MFSRSKLLAVVSLIVCCAAAQATSLKDFYAKSDREQATFVSDYVLKMRNDIATKNPELAQAIWRWFVSEHDGQPVSDGLASLLAEEVKVDALAKEGKADLTKVQIESLIVYVVKQKFR